MVWCQTSGNCLIIIVPVTVQCTLSVTRRRILSQKHGIITLRKASSNTRKTCPKERSYLTDVEEFSESGGTDPSDSSRISNNDSDGNEELGVQPYLYEPKTNTEGNANSTLRCYFMK